MNSSDKHLESLIREYPLPSSVQYEQQVIADAVLNPDTIPVIIGTVAPEMFADKQCSEAWSCITTMYNDAEPIDLVTFSTRCDGDFLNKLVVLNNNVGSELTVSGHCKALRDSYTRRTAYKFALNLLATASNKATTVEELFALPDSFAQAVQSAVGESNTTTVSEAINNLGDELQKKSSGQGLRVTTGFHFLDKILYGGFGAGNLIILAARPSVGKTAVMLQMAQAAAIHGIPTTVFSLEMTNNELAQRLLMSCGTMPGKDFASGQVQWDEFERCAGEFHGVPLFMNDKDTDIDGIVSRILIDYQRRKRGIVFIDYLGLINTSSRSQAPLYQVIASITRKLKQTAKRCQIPIVLLCQLNRASVAENRPPMLNDLRDSGSIEQDGDAVLMLEQLSGESDYPLRMWIRKNRNGRAGMFIPLYPNKTFTRFDEGEPCK